MVDNPVEAEASSADEPAELGVGYLRRLLGYAHKVYALGAVLARVRDGRQRPQIPMATVVRAVFACGLLRVRSFNALEPQLGEPQLLAALGLPPGPAPQPVCSVDTLARALRRADPASPPAMLAALIERAERNKVFRTGWIGALRYVALDGWEPIASRRRHCPQCLARELQDGKERVTEYYHRYVVALLLGPHEELVLGFEPVRNAWARRQAGERHVDGDEGEQTAAIRLLRWLRATYGRWLEVIVVDSLYPNGPFLTVLAELGFAGVIVAKKDSDEPLRDALAIWGDRPGQVVIDTDARERLELWDCPDCQTLTSYAGPIRVVRGVVDSLGRPAPRRQWCLLVVGKVTQRLSARQLLRVGRARWHIENTGFNQWTQHWRFEHVFTTDGNAIAAIFALFFVAFNVLQLFVYRQLKSYGRLRGKDPTRTISRVVDLLLADLHRLTAPVVWDSS
jgi:DDE family transposase